MPERFNNYLAETATTLPQLRGIGVTDAEGNWRYSSFPETPRHNVSDRSYFPYHRDTPDKALRISEVVQSRLDDRSSMIVVSKRITKLDGVSAALSPPRSTRIISSASTGRSSSARTAASA